MPNFTSYCDITTFTLISQIQISLYAHPPYLFGITRTNNHVKNVELAGSFLCIYLTLSRDEY